MKKSEKIYREYLRLGEQRGAISKIARKFGVSRQRVSAIVRKYKVGKTKKEVKYNILDAIWDVDWKHRYKALMEGRERLPKESEEWLELLREMIEEGASLKWIAEKTGRSENVISKFKKKAYGADE